MFPEVRGFRQYSGYVPERLLNSVILFSPALSLSAADALRDGEILEDGMRGNDAMTLYRSHLFL